MTKKAAKPLAQADDERIRRGPAVSRRERVVDDAKRTDQAGLVTSTGERRRLFRDEWTQEALPNPPPIPGFHLCWLSTTNQWDPIARRVRFGYVPVKVAELQGFEHLKAHSGEFVGCVSINEMVLFKIPEALYQEAMAEFHHHQPQEEEEAIRNRIDALEGEITDRKGNSLLLRDQEGDGMKHLVRKARVPHFQ